jgi:hypothetical protein
MENNSVVVPMVSIPVLLWSLWCLYRYCCGPYGVCTGTVVVPMVSVPVFFFTDTPSTSGAAGEKFGESLETPILCSIKPHFSRCLTVCLTAVYGNSRVVHFSYKSD